MKFTFSTIFFILWATLPGLTQNISSTLVVDCTTDSIRITAFRMPMTIEAVKNMVPVPQGSIQHTSLCGLCDCWYAIALKEGKTPEQAAWVALEKLAGKITTMNVLRWQKE